MALETIPPAQLEMETPPAQPEMAAEITPTAPLQRPLDWLSPKAPTPWPWLHHAPVSYTHLRAHETSAHL
eukprot:13696618-Alexandrium_andersonii.AAC.1